MKSGYTREKILIWAKTYPELSSRYLETVCTAGMLPSGKPFEIEQAVFSESHLTPADFKRTGQLRVKGTRRPLRVKPQDLQVAGGVDEHGAHVTVAFTLPAGSFATVLLRELMKAEPLD